MREKLERGITLVALVVTIVVLLILAGITIAMLFGQNGIITNAQKAKEETERAQVISNVQLDALAKQLEKNGGDITKNELEEILSKYGTIKYIDNDPKKDIEGLEVEGLSEIIPIAELYEGNLAISQTPIEKTTSYVGYYADFDPTDGVIDGIIYADLAVGGSGTWNSDSWSSYSYDAVTSGLKEYYISQESYTTTEFGTKPVLSPIGSGTYRFYVMALEDFTDGSHTYYYWYYSASGLTSANAYVSTDANDFGRGKANTTEMVEAWNNSTYGSQNGDSTYPDMWGVIQDKVNEGWFVPSKSEWSAFGDTFSITSRNYENFGLGLTTWSSSVWSESSPYVACFLGDVYIHEDSAIQVASVGFNGYVRLSATF